MKKLLLLSLAILLVMPVMAQKKNTVKKNAPAAAVSVGEVNDDGSAKKIYDEEIDPMSQIDEALELARQTSRFVICQVGGNWCPWCLRFAQFITKDPEISKIVDENFVYIHVNTSKEHKNYEALKRLGNPGRFGYPALVILNEEGNVMHIQNSSYLELDKSYDRKKVLEFFLNWTRQAIEEVK